MAKERTAHAYGPFTHGRKFRVVTVAADGTRGRRSFATYGEAEEYRDTFIRATETRTVGIAMEEYLAHLRVAGGKSREGLRESSLKTARYRLTAFFRLKEGDKALAGLTPAAVRRLYERRCDEVRSDTHRGELVLAQAACEWWARQGWIRGNVAEGIEPVGAKHARKAQPRVSEARLFLAAALGEGTREGLAAATCLLMGLRASEVCELTVRDLDDGGRLLWITQGKTENASRRIRTPSIIRPRLLELSVGKTPAERLFPDLTRHALHYHVKRLCDVAGIGKFGPHALRKAFVTLAIEGGGSGGGSSVAAVLEGVQRDVGHGIGSDVTLTSYAAAGAVESAGVTALEDLLAPGGNLGTTSEKTFPAGETSERTEGTEVVN